VFKKRLARLAVVFAALLSLALAGAAAASAQVTIGWTPPTTPTHNYCINEPFDGIQTSLASSAVSYAVPGAGLITSWSTNAGPGEGQRLTFKVFRPIGGGKYTVIAADLRSLSASTLNTFKVAIPVQTGDLIGTQDTGADEHPTSCAVETGLPGNEVTSEFGDVAVGGTLGFEIPEPEVQLNISATVLRVPTISALGATSGYTLGGTSVVIAGSEFAEVQSVKFGATAATFAVNSEGQITATAPAGVVGSVPVSVTTAAGTATSSQTFAYVAPCTVPKLKGKKLKAAKKILTKAQCKLGHVGKKKGVTAKTGKVVKQSSKVGTVRAPGSKVSVKLG
jgi:hypothetical protein